MKITYIFCSPNTHALHFQRPGITYEETFVNITIAGKELSVNNKQYSNKCWNGVYIYSSSNQETMVTRLQDNIEINDKKEVAIICVLIYLFT